MESAKMTLETVRIEPARPEETAEAVSDAIADLVAAATRLGQALHPRTAANLADPVRIANTYYSNLIEGHNTRPTKGAVSLRFPADTLEALFPRFFAEAGASRGNLDPFCPVIVPV
jgi:hypothetical protein